MSQKLLQHTYFSIISKYYNINLFFRWKNLDPYRVIALSPK